MIKYEYVYVSCEPRHDTDAALARMQYFYLPVPSLSSSLGFTKDGLTTSNHENSSAMNTR